MNERNQNTGQRNARFLRLCTIFVLSTTLIAAVLFMLKPVQSGVQVEADANGRFTLHLLPTTGQSLHIQHTADAIRISSAGGVRFGDDVQRSIQLPVSDDAPADMHITLGSDDHALDITLDADTDVWLHYDQNMLSVTAENALNLASAALDMPLAIEMVDQNRVTLGAAAVESLAVFGGDLHLIGPIVTNGDVIIDAVNVRIDADGAIQTSGSVTIDAVQNVQLTESRLQAAGNVRVQAGEVLLVRDSEKRPFQAQAGGTLQIQGSRQIDISALNHPASVIASGGDMRLQSRMPVRGDALYLAGGFFRIEQPDGKAGDLTSPYDPIVLADGDVTLGAYTGASLHIVAGGSVIMSSATITGSDTTANTINAANTTPFNGSDTIADLTAVTLSNGTPIAIDGSSRATLDVRAGVDWSTFAGVPGDQIIPAGAVTPSFAPAGGASITVTGEISIAQSSGLVLLTNQYRPNTALSGSITTANIDAGTDQAGQDAGSIIIDSRADIDTGALDAFAEAFGTSVVAGNGGAVTVLAFNGEIRTSGDVNTFARVPGNNSGSVGSGGEILFAAANGIDINSGSSSINSFAFANSDGNAGNGGDIILTTAAGDITAQTLNSSSFAVSTGMSAGNGGSMTLSTGNGGINLPGTIFTDIRAYSISGDVGGNGGTIVISATQGITIGQDVQTNANGTGGNGGAVRMTTTGGDISAGDIWANAVDSEPPGSGGSVTLLANGGGITTGDVWTFSNALLIHNDSQDGGEIMMQALGGDATTGELLSYSAARGQLGDTGNGGSISVTANGSITTTGSVQAYALAANNNSNSGIAGLAGDVTLQATGTISIAGSVDAYSSSTGQNGSAADGGTIDISANNGNIRIASSVNSYANASGFPSGDAGDGGNLSLIAGGGIDVRNGSLNSYAFSNEGTVGSGGSIVAITTNGDVLLETAVSYARNAFAGSSLGTGSGGNITLSTGNGRVVVDPNTFFAFGVLSADASGPDVIGNSGAVVVAATQGISVVGQITTYASGAQGNAGDVRLTTTGGDIDTGDINAGAVDNSDAPGSGGDVTVRALAGGVNTGDVIAYSYALLIHNDSFDGGNITIDAGDGDVTTGKLVSFTEARGQLGDTGNGGTIAVTAGGNITTTGPIESYALAAINNSNSGIAGNAGSVNLQAGGGISITGSIDSFSAAPGPNGSAANAGDVTVTAVSDILFTHIDARSQSDTGTIGVGGVVDINSGRFVLGKDTIANGADFNGLETIATGGLTGSSAITITHGGGGVTPFDVGSAAANGVLSVLDSGDTLITPTASFLYSHFEAPNIWILSLSHPLTMTKSAAPSVDVPFRGEITYTLVLSNPAALDAVGVFVTDTLPVEVDFNRWVQQPVGADVTADLLTWNGDVPANSAITFEFVADHVGSAGDLFTNTAEFAHPATLGSGSAAAAVQINAAVDISVVKTAVPTTAAPGDTIQYVLAFTNAGPGIARNVVISDSVPAELTNLSFTGSGAAIASIGGTTFAWTTADLEVDEGGTITITGDLVTPLARDLLFGNTAVITTTSVDADGSNNSDTADVMVLNAAPQPVDDTAVTDEDVPVNIAVLDNDGDPNGDGLTLAAVGPAGSGVASLNGNTVDYAPALNFNGMDTFTYTVSDGLQQRTASVAVTVNPVNDAPVAGDNAYNTAEDTPLTINAAAGVLSNDFDVDGDALEAGLVSDVTSGALLLAVDGSFVFTPTLNFVGIVTFTYEAIDPDEALSNVATVTINVGEENDAPVVVDDEVNVDEDTAVTIDALFNDSDPDGDSLAIVAVGNAANGAASLNANRIDYVPALNFNGTDVFTYTAGDGQINVQGIVTVTVNPVNDAPQFTSAPLTSIVAGSLYSYTLRAEDVDLNAQLTFSATVLPAWLTFLNPTDGPAAITGTPADADVGDHPVVAAVSDGELSDTQMFTVTVTAVPTIYTLFLPVVVSQEPVQPEPADLTIVDLVVSGDAITVTIENGGPGPTTGDFWVDVYVNPSAPPAINQTWQLLADHGLAWGVTDVIPAGGTLTLTIGGSYFVPAESDFIGLVSGDMVWGQVDSVNLATTHGNLLEVDETNNVYGPVAYNE